MSLERKLPLLITGLLALVLATSVALAYREVRRSEEVVAVDRLDRAARQLAELVAASTDQRAKLLRQAASDPAVQRAVINPAGHDGARVSAALGKLVIRTDSTLPIQLWTVEGRKIATVGNDAADGGTGGTQPPLVGGKRLDAGSPRLLSPTVYFGPFYVSQNAVYYWVAAPVIVGGQRRGWITQQGRIASRPETSRRVNGLIGGGSKAYFRNTIDSFWATIGGTPVSAPRDAPTRVAASSTLTATRAAPGGQGSATESPVHDTASYSRGGTQMLAAQAPISGTPWALVVEVPRASVTASARMLLRRFGLVSLVLLLIGAASAWVLSRSITRPLSAVTLAADAVARGQYETRVTAAGDDEVARLANSFNSMAADVAVAHAELKRRVVEVEKLADERDAALATAVSASTAKSSFLATMSHEIRTPINAILGYADILALGIAGPLTGDQHDFLARVKVSTEHLLGLVNEVLDIAKVESGTMQVGSAIGSTNEVIHAATSLVQPQAAARGIDISVHNDGASAATFIGDDQRVRQALANLLSNAVKFSRPGGHIAITFRTVTAPLGATQLVYGNPYVAFHVADDGIGIAPEDMARIFQPFTQLETAAGNPYTRAANGAGLGLAISRQLARLMGGDITVESELGKGSNFTLWIPAPAVGATAAATVNAAADSMPATGFAPMRGIALS